MKSRSRIPSFIVLLGLATCAISTIPVSLVADEGIRSGDEDWRDVAKASEDPPEGKAIRGRRINGEERLRLRALLHTREIAAADLAAAFRSRHPGHTNAAAALKIELEQLLWAADVAIASDTNLFARVNHVVREFIADARFSEKDRFALTAAALNRVAYARFNGVTNATAATALLDVELADARFLQQAFPAVEEIWDYFQLVAGQMAPARARPVLDEILLRAPPGSRARSKAEGLKWRLDAQGKPLRMAFTAIDGRMVDTAAWRGKVVLVDFWATWCGPCVAEMPGVRDVYERFHERGFEVLGVSLDMDKQALEKFQARHKLPWPQYCDGQGWSSTLVARYGVSLIPTIWLLDKRGVIRHLDARENLAEKVEALLDESLIE